MACMGMMIHRPGRSDPFTAIHLSATFRNAARSVCGPPSVDTDLHDMEEAGVRPHAAPALTAILGALIVMTSTTGHAAGEQRVVLGADLTPAEWEQMSQRFGIDPAGPTDTVTTAEIVAALRD